MGSYILIVIFFTIVISLFVTWRFGELLERRDRARAGDYPKGKCRGVYPNPMFFLVSIVLILAVMVPAFFRGQGTEGAVWFCAFMAEVSIYYVFLVCTIPLFRRTTSAEGCVELWVLPFLIWLLPAGYNPKFVLTVPKSLIRPAMWVWIVGIGLVICGQVILHVAYRGWLKGCTVGKCQPETEKRWLNECRTLSIKRDIPVYIAENISTPVTVGLFQRSMALFLPKREYTYEELGMILSHEAQHISRKDTQSKLVLGLIAALSWFNPFSWIATRKAAEDFELSCDEEVLYAAFPGERRTYAELLLKSADTSWGYSSCLSSSARSLRYRLRSIMKPKKRLDGTLAVFIAMVILILSMGTIGIADRDTITVGDILLLPDEIQAKIIGMDTDAEGQSRGQSVPDGDEEALKEYICGLKVREVIYGEWKGTAQSKCFWVLFKGENYSIGVDIYDDFISIKGHQFVLADDADWDYFRSLINY